LSFVTLKAVAETSAWRFLTLRAFGTRSNCVLCRNGNGKNSVSSFKKGWQKRFSSAKKAKAAKAATKEANKNEKGTGAAKRKSKPARDVGGTKKQIVLDFPGLLLPFVR
jgi:hypothetical protein